MSEVWNKAVRKNRVGRCEQSSPEDKLRAIRALYIVVYNDDKSLIPLSTELFHVLGELLEGRSLEEINLFRISKEKVLEAFDDLKNN